MPNQTNADDAYAAAVPFSEGPGRETQPGDEEPDDEQEFYEDDRSIWFEDDLYERMRDDAARALRERLARFVSEGDE